MGITIRTAVALLILGTVSFPLAFTSPLFGALMGIMLGGEVLTWKTILGTLLTVGGIILLTI